MERSLPWQSRLRASAQRLGVDPRNFRRFRWLHKARVLRTYGAGLRDNIGFVLLDPEPHNFTYELSNLDDLVPWVAAVAGVDAETAARLVAEPASDHALALRLRGATSARWLWTKRAPPFGKRVGWYALARALQPRLIVETGVHDGLGSMLLLRALERNSADGHDGRLISFDVNPSAGWLVGTHPRWEFLPQASTDGLPSVLHEVTGVDLFIYDGWHSYEHELAELQLVAEHLTPEGVMVSDDAQVTSALADLSKDRGMACSDVSLQSANHFHPGSVLAAARRSRR